MLSESYFWWAGAKSSCISKIIMKLTVQNVFLNSNGFSSDSGNHTVNMYSILHINCTVDNIYCKYLYKVNASRITFPPMVNMPCSICVIFKVISQ